MIDLEPILRAVVDASRKRNNQPPVTNDEWEEMRQDDEYQSAVDLTLDTYLATLKAIREPSEGMVREGISWNTTPEKWTAMIGHLIQEAGGE